MLHHMFLIVIKDTTGEKIDEMKLHKLLYFAQRESIIQENGLFCKFLWMEIWSSS